METSSIQKDRTAQEKGGEWCQVIAQREQGNDGTQMHLYYDANLDAYQAYGESAYALRIYAKANGMESLRGHSSAMNMPVTMVPVEVVQILCKQLSMVEGTDGAYYLFNLSRAFSQSDFREGITRLEKQISSESAPFVVTTSVSEYIPKNEYIHDKMGWTTRNIKRVLDMIISAMCLILFFPLMLAIYVAIRMEDGKPAIYSQTRVGRFGQPFKILKFRSMKVDSEQNEPKLSPSGNANDDRVTRVGRFIRAHHLDELPQLYNVFIGDMAFVGYRPERPFFIDQIMEHDYRYSYLYQIRPGVTSYATLYNGYTDTMEKMLKRLEYDLYYLGHRTFWFDATILFRTFFSIILGKKI